MFVWSVCVDLNTDSIPSSSGNVSTFSPLPWASLVAQMVKNLPAIQETQVQSLGRKDPLEKEWQPTPVLLSGEFHGQRSLMDYSPWSHKESDTTERLTLSLHFHVEVKVGHRRNACHSRAT